MSIFFKEVPFFSSGGGTVYHDLGNLNCTFFTRRSRYDRRRNLEIICSAIRRSTDLNVSVNKREDIVLNNEHKISGTAAKLGKDTAYHHCTVLVNVNECVLHDALDSKAVSLYRYQLAKNLKVQGMIIAKAKIMFFFRILFHSF